MQDKLSAIKEILESEDTAMPLTIGVLQRGHVVVGNMAIVDSEVQFHNAAVVRRWGTTNGLGELAENGPLPNTKLDKCPRVRCHHLAVVMLMDCNGQAWGDSWRK